MINPQDGTRKCETPSGDVVSGGHNLEVVRVVKKEEPNVSLNQKNETPAGDVVSGGHNLEVVRVVKKEEPNVNLNKKTDREEYFEPGLPAPVNRVGEKTEAQG